MNWTLVNKDAIDFIKYIKSVRVGFIDLVLTDPPYNISRKNNFKTIGRNGIDFGTWDYGFDQTTWIKEISPLIKSGGSLIIFKGV